MIITIASGKGGTGKTTLAVNLAEYLKEKVNYENGVFLLDCDVEAPNDKLFLNVPEFKITKVEELKPVWDKQRCKGCGKCKAVCRYNAIARLPNKTIIFKELCHSCGACNFICPNGAITEEPYALGKIFEGTNDKKSLVYGELNIGEIASPAVVKAVKKKIKRKALNIIDAPPGTGCSVVATLEDSDFSILVTEPTPFGLHDLRLAAQMVQKLKIPFGVVINRSDGNDGIIMDFLTKFNIPLIGKIPFDRKYAEAYSNGKILVNEFDELKQYIDLIYENCLKEIKNLEKIKKITVETELQPTSKKNKPEYKKNDEADILKEIMIISGKGGTGKTTVSAAFSYLADIDKCKAVFEDCDVDAADLHLLLKPNIIEKKDFSGANVAEIINEACTGCGKCVKYCRFDAVKFTKDSKFEIDDMKCEGCGFCLLVCPHSAIIEKKKINGKEFISETEYGLMSHAELGIAEENSGKLVTVVKNNALSLAEKTNAKMILGDGPPGSGCPVIASVSNIDLAVIVTEPTMSGMNDMIRVLQLAKHFNVKTKIIINKSDLNKKIVQKIKILANSHNSEVIAEIPFDRNINDALIKGEIITKYKKGKACKEIEKAWERLKELIL